MQQDDRPYKATFSESSLQSFTYKYESIIPPMARVYIDKPDYKNFQKKVEKFQLAITGRIQETSTKWLCDELGLHSLAKRYWRHKLIFFLQRSKLLRSSKITIC